ncbi:DNA cytosine methyltransferase [Dyella telluris]|uniref:Cytosine-specific methyltransferase n=2 Tax=Dyella telluris TaxID=2763498 RepID=A0A7G8QAE7_9GAMM|nr:DNA cytosine methyltransferase [Dyella telluris]
MSSWIAQAIDEKIARDNAQQSALGAHDDVNRHRFYEFFAGGGMARAGLGAGWDCVFANDFDPMKARVYRDNWDGGQDLLVEDINKLAVNQLTGQADLVWASFPCQDLSLAGNYNGIGHWQDREQTRSGTFWPFWQLMRDLMNDGRGPKLIVLENVYGVLTSNEGRDFAAIGSAFSGAGYRFGAMVIDARLFVPHSRPRVFVVGVRRDVSIPASLCSTKPVQPWHPDGMQEAYQRLSKEARKGWLWWNPPEPMARPSNFVDLIEENPTSVAWDSAERTKSLLGMMSDINKKKVAQAQNSGRRVVGGVYRRTRIENGEKIQRAEVRFDDVAGCLRTPAGGSSRQHILLVEGKKIRSRLLSPREAARLMGLPDTYKLPTNYNDAYHVAGDGVAVPVVRHLAASIFEPILVNSVTSDTKVVYLNQGVA